MSKPKKSGLDAGTYQIFCNIIRLFRIPSIRWMCARTINKGTALNSCATSATSNAATQPRPHCAPTSTAPTTPEASAKVATKRIITCVKWTSSPWTPPPPNPQEWRTSATAQAPGTHSPQQRSPRQQNRTAKVTPGTSKPSPKRSPRDEYPS